MRRQGLALFAKRLGSRAHSLMTRQVLSSTRSISSFNRLAVADETKLNQPKLGQFRLFSSDADYSEVVPPLGDSISEGTIVEWTAGVGDYVDQDQVIMVLETDKVSVDIRASQAGVLTGIQGEEGDTVEVGAQIATIDTSAEKPAGSATAAAPEPAAAASPSPSSSSSSSSPPPPPPPPPASSTGASSSSSSSSIAWGGRETTRVPMTRMRQTIAKRMIEAQDTAASLTTFNEIDMSGIMQLRNKYKDDFLEAHGCKLGFMSIFVKAATKALQKFPDVNGVIEGKDILYRDFVDVSVAVATPTGLVVPVLRNTETMSFADVEQTIAELGQRARNNQISLEEMAGGTFTISNGGVFGSVMGTPILNMPQSAILGMHGIHKRPIAVGDEVQIRPMMYIALTYDHRIIDGGTAVQFLRTIKDNVEDPTRLLFDV